MQYFAKRIDYVANIVSFVSLIELYEESAEEPFCYAIYYYHCRGDNLIYIELFESAEEAKEKFPYGRAGYGSHAPRHQYQVLTARWLHEVSVGGSYQQHEQGVSVEVELPVDFPYEFLQKQLAV